MEGGANSFLGALEKSVETDKEKNESRINFHVVFIIVIILFIIMILYILFIDDTILTRKFVLVDGENK